MVDTNEIFGRRVACDDSLEHYFSWAEALLMAGEESDALAILVGLGLDARPCRDEIELYFERSLDELRLVEPPRELALECYEVVICRSIVNGETKPTIGLDALIGLHDDNSGSFWEWLQFEDYAVADGYSRNFSTPKIFYDYIKCSANRAVYFEYLKSELDFSKINICADCGWMGIFESEECVCGSCNSPNCFSLNSSDGRRVYIFRAHELDASSVLSSKKTHL